MHNVPFSDLKGVVLAKVEGLSDGSDVVLFVADDGRSWKMWHDQDCCECVRVYDLSGDVSDLIGSPILMAEESTNRDDTFGVDAASEPDSYTWTFYKLATIRGAVTIRWLGDGKGSYGAEVSFSQL